MIKRKRYLSILKRGLWGLFFFLFLIPSPVLALEGCDCSALDYADPTNIRLDCAFVCILGGAIDTLFALVVPVAVVLLIFGGFRYMASGGDQRAMESTKKFLTWVIIGTILALGAVLVFKVINSIIEGS